MKGVRGLMVVAVLATCTAGAEAGIGGYFKDRGNDILDIFRARAGWPEHGRAIGAKARVTSLAQIGYVTFDGSYAGLEKRGIGVVDERRHEGGVSVVYASAQEMVTTSGNHYMKASTAWSLLEDRRILRNLPHWDDGRRRPLSIGAELALPIGALDLGIYPEEIADLITGIFTIDLFNDDVPSDVTIPNAEATTAPEPKLDAPFADRRAAFDAWKAAQDKAKLEASGQLGEEPAPSTTEGGETSPTLQLLRTPALDTEVAPTPEPIRDSEMISDPESEAMSEALRAIEESVKNTEAQKAEVENGGRAQRPNPETARDPKKTDSE